MKISFLLPQVIKIPIGGVKIIYRYASELSILGHEVCIISPIKEKHTLYHIIKEIAILFWDFYHGVQNRPYYKTPNNVKHLIIPSSNKKYIPDANVIIATGWQTALWVNDLPKSKGKKYYFIQGQEIWLGNYNKVMNTWILPINKIVISNWLKHIANKLDQTVIGPIPNAIDKNEFFITKPIHNRSQQITMLYHRASIKGAHEGIEVLKQIKKKNSNLKALIFSARKPNCRIPKWISLEIRPSINRLREIYNSTAIFIHTSYSEGWGLTPAESMMCGCAVVASANNGVQEYLHHNKTGLLSPIGDIDQMVNHIQFLIDNNDVRIRLAEKGNSAIRIFSWGKNVKQFEKALLDNK